ncbi:MAG: hypothetical protein C0490_25755, partial [Marivirga sp.]|nr:hypothetical protein [Marivirga sp.]
MLWILLICSPLLASNLSSSTLIMQTDAVRGRILDDSGTGIPGVNIIIKGTSNGTTSDADGRYTISIPSNSADGILVYSFIGYATQEQPISGRSTIDVTLAADVTSLSEVIVVGYGTQEKRDVTSSISTVSGEAISKIPTGNAMDALKGQVAGVDVLQNGGRPGQAPTITVRGRRSLTASNEPLWVIDGIPMTAGASTISDFNTADIESVEVLKDAASQAVYGSRGSNGVILVTTKRGRPGVTRINFTTTYGVSQAWRTIPMMNGEQFADLKR